MNRHRLSCGSLAFALALSTVPLIAADDQLAHVKRLYVAGQYEEALVALDPIPAGSSSEAEEYRVLCLLSLGRVADAEQSVERIILRNPLAGPDLAGRSPKFSATVLKVRTRVLGLVAQTMYGLARASFDAGNAAMASAQFRELVALLEKNAGATEPLNDLNMLADGFARLSRQRAEASAPAASESKAETSEGAAPEPGAETPAAEVPVEEMLVSIVLPPEDQGTAVDAAADDGKPFAPWRPQVFGAEDPDVTPPVTIDQQMPAWIAPAAYAATTFRGTLEILVGEDGLVTSVRSLERTHPRYDTLLLAAAKRWRYEPAVKHGRPVQYRKMLEFTLRGR